MDYHRQFVLDFARRTRANLEFIEAAEQRGDTVFEVTQLCNSLLGLLVFPRERYMRSIPETPLSELVERGWPEIRTSEGQLEEENLRQLTRMLRNGIAHCNVEFDADETGQIAGLTIWSRYKGRTTWKAELTLADLRSLVFKFVELMEEEEGANE